MSKGFLVFSKILAGLVLACFILFLVSAGQGAAGTQRPPVTPTPAPTAEPAAPATPSPTPQPTPEPTPSPTPEPTPQPITISLLGDCTLASYPEISHYGNSFENVVQEDWAYPFSHTVDILSADDFTIANLECTLSDTVGWSSSTFSFRAPAAAVNILLEGSVEYVTTANNHSLDFGQALYDESNAVLENAGIGHSGEGEWSVYETGSGVKIGVYSVFNYYAPSAAAMAESIAAMREAGAEIVIVAVHWGIEGTYYQTGDQQTAAHAAIDAGADIIYGSHPHRLQPVESYNGGLIFYSMANWCFGGNTNPADKDTAIAQIHFQRELDGSITLLDYSAIPCSISSKADVNDYCPTPYEEGSADYARALSKLDGSFNGENTIPDYSFMHQDEEG